jgi:UDP-N-acetylmuramate dehydrogenase
MLNIQENVILAPFTTFRIGGPARYFVEVRSEEELIKALDFAKEKNLKFFILGGGSNLLVADQGFDGVVIKMKFNEFSIDSEKAVVEVGAGVPLSKVVRDTAATGMTGMEWAAGIPGTFGGAVRGNAGAYGGEAKDVTESVKIIDAKTREIKEIVREDCNFIYRGSLFKDDGALIIISAKLKLAKGNAAESQRRAKEIIVERIGKNPQGIGSAGSYFINPVVNNPDIIAQFEKESGKTSKVGKVPAGWLIEKADLRGKRIGGAMLSENHSNYIVNTGTATAADVVMLDSFIKQQVRDKFGVQLQEEVQYLGFK